MFEGITASVIFAVFLLVTSVTFLFLTTGWTDLSLDTAQVIDRQRERVDTAVAISSAVENGVACTDFTAQVSNSGKVAIHDFSEMDLVVEYLNASDTKVVARLTNGATWSVSGISPDNRDPNKWNPGETATIAFTLPSAMKANENGTVLLSTRLAISDSNYFTCT